MNRLDLLFCQHATLVPRGNLFLIANFFYEIVFVRLIRHLAFHCAEADDDGPQVGAGFWDHQGAHYRDCFGEKNYREVAAEAQHDGQPHPAEGAVVLLFGTAEVKHDD